MTDELHPIAQCMVDAGLSHIKPSEQVAALEARLARHSEYSIDLARIIEDLCHSREIREPQTSARFHYDMAVAYRSTLTGTATPKPEGERIADAVLAWMVKYDLLDAGNEYRAEDIIDVLDDLAPIEGAALDIGRASESIAGMVADWYGNAPLPNARITASIIAKRLSRFIPTPTNAGVTEPATAYQRVTQSPASRALGPSDDIYRHMTREEATAAKSVIEDKP